MNIAIGQCFPFANKLVREMEKDGIYKDIVVVHGTIVEPMAIDPNRHRHAWVEAGGRAYDWQLMTSGVGSLPLVEYYQLFKPDDIQKYNPVEAAANQLKFCHHGPW